MGATAAQNHFEIEECRNVAKPQIEQNEEEKKNIDWKIWKALYLCGCLFGWLFGRHVGQQF